MRPSEMGVWAGWTTSVEPSPMNQCRCSRPEWQAWRALATMYSMIMPYAPNIVPFDLSSKVSVPGGIHCVDVEPAPREARHLYDMCVTDERRG